LLTLESTYSAVEIYSVTEKAAIINYSHIRLAGPEGTCSETTYDAWHRR
jgi:hypothetical protein